jgi:hypothetical protein
MMRCLIHNTQHTHTQVVDKGTKNSHFKTPQTIRLIGAFLASQQQSDAASVAPFTAKLLTTYTQAYLGATLDLSGRGSTLSHSFSEFVGACVTDADVKSVIAPEIERLLKRDPAKTVPGLAILCEGVAARTDLSAYVGVWKESLFKELVSNDASRSETAARALKALHRGVRGVDARIELIGQAQEYLGGRQRSLATKPADKVKVMTVIQDCMAAHTDEKTQTAGIDAMLAYVKSERIVGTRNAAMGVLAAVCEGLPAGPLLTQRGRCGWVSGHAAPCERTQQGRRIPRPRCQHRIPAGSHGRFCQNHQDSWPADVDACRWCVGHAEQSARE